MHSHPAFPDGDAWAEFLAMSARLGQDIALVQGAGGNTSLKIGETLWIKASGTWLAEAETRHIMVPVDLPAITARIADRSLQESAIAGLTGRVAGVAPLRASVETPFHALLPAACVVHVHCVATLAVAMRPDAEAVLSTALHDLDWGFIPYLKPGVPLTFALHDTGLFRRQVIVLGNHGLIVSGPTPAAAEALLRKVQQRLDIAPAPPSRTSFAATGIDLDGTGYQAAPPGPAHALACDPDLRALATGGAIAPDFVVFFGPNLPRLRAADLSALGAFSTAPLPMNSVVLVEGRGVLLRSDAMRGTEEILHGFYAALARLAARGGTIRYLTPDDIAALMQWDAEKYRQSLNGGKVTG